MVIKVADGTTVVCEEHEVAAVIKPWLDEVEYESADWLQFQVMRGEDTRQREYHLGVAIRR